MARCLPKLVYFLSSIVIHAHKKEKKKRGVRNMDDKSLADRLWDKVTIRGPDECWMWTGAKIGGNRPDKKYGWMQCGKVNGRHTQDYVHRVAYELYRGEIPEGMIVRHLCYQRLCCNPAHLEVAKKGTWTKEERNKALGLQENG